MHSEDIKLLQLFVGPASLRTRDANTEVGRLLGILRSLFWRANFLERLAFVLLFAILYSSQSAPRALAVFLDTAALCFMLATDSTLMAFYDL